jgi:hypothetical protein
MTTMNKESVMDKEEIQKKMAEQVGIVIDAAREKFTDALEGFLKGKNIELTIEDQLKIDKLFSDTAYTYFVAEMAVFLSYMFYRKMNDEGIVKQIVPSFLDECEARLDHVPAVLTEKTKDLKGIAKKILASREEKSPIVEHLLRDIAEMPQMKHLRASFHAGLLNFMGE